MATDIEDDDEEYQSSGSGLYAIFRKIMFVLAGFFLLWTYATQNFKPPHAPAQTDSATDTKPAAYPPTTYPVGRSINTTSNALFTAATPVSTPAAPEAVASSPAAATTHAATDEAPVSAPPTTSAADREHIGHLENQLQEQEKTLDTLKAEIGELRAAKEQLQASAEQSNHKLAVVTALGLFIEAIHSGEPYSAQLNQLYAALPADANHDKMQALLDNFKPRAEKGIPTYEQLLVQFNERLPHALVPDEHAPAWKKSLQSLIRIRKVGEPQGADDEAVLARAESKLNHHDINGAVSELQSLSQSAAAVMEPWLGEANALLDSTKTLNDLQLALISTPNA